MANTSFRLDTFRQWDPFQDKARTLRDPSSIYRYPSPVSITATPPPSNASNIVSRAPKGHSLPKQDKILFPLALQSRFAWTASQAPGLEPADPNHLTANSDGPTRAREPYDSENIDPVILCVRGYTGMEHVRESESVLGTRLGQELALAQQTRLPDSRPSDANSPSRPSQLSVPGGANYSSEQDTLAGKRLSPTRKRAGKVSSRLPNPKTRRRKPTLFPTVRSQFLAMSVQGRMQFLSWLFEGVLSHCVSVSQSTEITPAFGCSAHVESEMAYDRDHPDLSAEIADAQNNPSTDGPAFHLVPWLVKECLGLEWARRLWLPQCLAEVANARGICP